MHSSRLAQVRATVAWIPRFSFLPAAVFGKMRLIPFQDNHPDAGARIIALPDPWRKGLFGVCRQNASQAGGPGGGWRKFQSGPVKSGRSGILARRIARGSGRWAASGCATAFANRSTESGETPTVSAPRSARPQMPSAGTAGGPRGWSLEESSKRDGRDHGTGCWWR